MRLHSVVLVYAAAAVLIAAPRSWGQFSSASASLSAATIPAAQQIQPQDMLHLLSSRSNPPLVLQVGSRIFFDEAHIPGSKYAGPGSQASGLQLLETTVSSLPKDKPIVLYCGCCPWGRCPNVGPAFKRLRDLGFTNVKVLYLANNFGDDWVSKGYPSEHQ